MIKKLLTVLFSASALWVHAQSGITNLDFEYWSGSLPDGFYGMGVSQQNSGAQSGTNYARISITNPATDGLMLIGASIANRGAAYNQRPVSISGYYRTSFPSADTMAIAAGLYLNSAAVAPLDFYPIFVDQPNWTPFTLPFNYANGNTPDTLQLIFYANTLFINGSQNTTGSYLEVDNLTLDLTTGLAPFEHNHVPLQPYPNPATDRIRISGPAAEPCYAFVFNAAGRLMNRYALQAGSASLDLNSYENGIYFYQVKTGYGEVISASHFAVVK